MGIFIMLPTVKRLMNVVLRKRNYISAVNAQLVSLLGVGTVGLVGQNVATVVTTLNSAYVCVACGIHISPGLGFKVVGGVRTVFLTAGSTVGLF